LTDPLDALLNAVTEPIRFAVWSDNLLAAEELNIRLHELGQTARAVTADTVQVAECLVVLTQKSQLSAADVATWARLANRAEVDIGAYNFTDAANDVEFWPSGTRLRWSGDFRDLGHIAKALVDLLRPAGLRFARLPTLFPTNRVLPGVQVADARQTLVELLTSTGQPRVIPMSRALFAELSQPRPAVSRQDYDLMRLVRWNTSRYGRALISLRIGRPNELSSPLSAPRSLEDVVHAPLTSRLVLLLGEPGSGKTLQLRYFDAQAALRSIRMPDHSWTANSFYVALSEQPAQPNISVNWLAQRWRSAVDVQKWCALDQFLADGGTVLLDGLNEGGMRAVPLEQWMLQWRDVIHELFDKGAGRIVVTCRTRDQLIPLRAPRGELPTAVTVLPLSKQDIVAIATQQDPQVARQLDAAMAGDLSLADLYANPFRLRAYLESGVPGVATTGATLFGLQISAAILRERDQLNFHDDLIPRPAAARLAAVQESGDENPWSTLGNIPLIKTLGALAKVLTFPTEPDGRARLTMQRDEAGRVLTAALHDVSNSPVDADLIVDTARDLHILVEENSKIRFAHPTLQHLFAASGCSVEEVITLAKDEQQRRLKPHTSASPGSDRLPPIMTPPSYVDHRYDEVFQFAAQLRGTEIPDGLERVDPVLAARVYLSIRAEVTSPTASKIITTLGRQLDSVRGHRERSAIIAALGDLGWLLPQPLEDGVRAVAQVPNREWRLGLRSHDQRSTRSVASEFRIIELPGFRISRFPVYNAEFAAFIQDGGYNQKAFWTPEGWEWRMRSRTVEQFVAEWGRRRDILRRHPERIVMLLRSGRATPAGAAALVRFAGLQDADIAEHARMLQARPVMAPKYWEKTALKNPLQPVVGVSWFEANAFCEWLSKQLGLVVRLASEDEWEAACLYSLDLQDAAEVDQPVNLSFGNTVELGYPATTPICTFATARQTQLNLPVEFLGNVFEWVFDHYAPGDHNRHTVKGGSWRHEAWRAHPAYRGRGDVDTQNDDIGFRYVIAEGRP
jgi:formylglycine-generating enzyme required for sulfatase activity